MKVGLILVMQRSGCYLDSQEGVALSRTSRDSSLKGMSDAVCRGSPNIMAGSGTSDGHCSAARTEADARGDGENDATRHPEGLPTVHTV